MEIAELLKGLNIPTMERCVSVSPREAEFMHRWVKDHGLTRTHFREFYTWKNHFYLLLFSWMLRRDFLENIWGIYLDGLLHLTHWHRHIVKISQ